MSTELRRLDARRQRQQQATGGIAQPLQLHKAARERHLQLVASEFAVDLVSLQQLPQFLLQSARSLLSRRMAGSALRDSILVQLPAPRDESSSSQPSGSGGGGSSVLQVAIGSQPSSNASSSSSSSGGSSSSSSKAVDVASPSSFQESVQRACSSVSRRILLLAFGQWRAQAARSRTLRQHLGHLLQPDASIGRWEELRGAGRTLGLTAIVWQLGGRRQICEAVYRGGCPQQLRRAVWPLLLGIHSWHSTLQQRRRRAAELQAEFESLVSEWKPLEAMIREKERATHVAGRQQRQLGLQTHRDESIDCDGARTQTLSSDSNSSFHSPELIQTFARNWRRIEMDVVRCDRHLASFRESHQLEPLRSILCCYVWQNPETGYIQGFCDLLAPLLVVVEEEGLVLGCFRQLMLQIGESFTSLMDEQLSSVRALVQLADPQLHAHLSASCDAERYCFCYRWLLLQFKREFSYSDTFLLWETAWAARQLGCRQFSVFLAAALLLEYRDVIIGKAMDFSDVVLFFNGAAERHNARTVARRARSLVTAVWRLCCEQAAD